MEKNTRMMMISIIAIIIIVANNAFFYYVLKNALEKNSEKEVTTTANQIQSSIEQSRLGAKQYEDKIGEELRTASIVIKYALPPHLKDVKEEDLQKLKTDLHLDEISLMTKTPDDIIVSKSTDTKEIGMSTKGWGEWYIAFKQLFDDKNVSLNWGQKLPNYWSGPYEVAASDTKTIYKWGYYFDGTTDYIIDPYVGDADYKKYLKGTGMDAIIQNTLKQDPSLLEITGINPATFGKDPKTYKIPAGDLTPLVFRPYFFGSYNFVNLPKDASYVQETLKTKTAKSYRAFINGKNVTKTFIPIHTTMLNDVRGTDEDAVQKQDTYVLAIVSDYEFILNSLNHQFTTLISIIILGSILALGLLLFLIRWIGKSKDKAVQQTSKTYTEEVNQMFLNIRGQRHDFLNHVSVIHSLVETGKFEELKKFTNSFIGEIDLLNDVISIGQPEIAAIIQAKMVSAMNRRIQFIHDFESINYTISGSMSVDIVRIIGNLIDNAFDEVEKLEGDNRWIECKCLVEGKKFHFVVTNPIQREIDQNQRTQFFKAGYSSKTEGHQGLGLAIVHNLIQKYRGDIKVDSDMNIIKFHIILPLKEGIAL